jgi:hypothetical protein
MRVDVPRHLRRGELAPHFVHLVNLSPLGAQVTDLEPWDTGFVCSVDLPPSLGTLRLSGRVVWTRLRSTEQNLAGDRREHYESGIEFTGLTPAQQKALADTLQDLAPHSNPHSNPSLEPITRTRRCRRSAIMSA